MRKGFEEMKNEAKLTKEAMEDPRKRITLVNKKPHNIRRDQDRAQLWGVGTERNGNPEDVGSDDPTTGRHRIHAENWENG